MNNIKFLGHYGLMNLTFRQLKVLESVVRHLNYTNAAKELHLSQPAVSMQIKQLEEQARTNRLRRLFVGDTGVIRQHLELSCPKLDCIEYCTKLTCCRDHKVGMKCALGF